MTTALLAMVIVENASLAGASAWHQSCGVEHCPTPFERSEVAPTLVASED
ncbi:MAG TPA: hypothetical protein V6D34_07385 [Candidatus Sericytochromatia bacterium]